MKTLQTILILMFFLLAVRVIFATDMHVNQIQLAVQSSSAKNPRIVSIYDTSNSPLPSNMINCITLDGSMNKWIGTSNGLVKYDGTLWTIYNTSNSGITGNNVTHVTIDTDGVKWIYSTDGNLVSFDDVQWTVHSSITGLYSLEADNQGNIWVGQSSLLSEFSHGWWTEFTTMNSGVPQSNINAISFNYLGYKFLGTESTGLVRFDGSNWIPYNQTNTGQPINSIVSLYYDMQNKLWIGTTNHAVVMYDGINWTSYQASNSPFANDASISCISQGNVQAVWFGTTNQGLIKRSANQWIVYATSDTTFPTNEIKSIAIDNLDVKWVGTSMGLVRMDNLTPINPDDPSEPLPDHSIILFCYPNPFNPSTTLEYDLIESDQVELVIYNTKGQLIRKLRNEMQSIGHHQISWDGRDQNEHIVSSGMYLCNLKVGTRQVTKKIMLLK